MKAKLKNAINYIYKNIKKGISYIFDKATFVLAYLLKLVIKLLKYVSKPIQAFGRWILKYVSKPIQAFGRWIFKYVRKSIQAVGRWIFKIIKYLEYQVKKLLKFVTKPIVNFLQKFAWGRWVLKKLECLNNQVKKLFKYIGESIQAFCRWILKILMYIRKSPKAFGRWIKRVLKYLNKYQVKKKIWGVIFLTPWIMGFLLFFFKPFIESLYFSFHTVKPSQEGLIINFVGLERYIYALTVHVNYFRILVESMWDIFVNLWVILIFSLLMAVLLNSKFRGRTFARAVFFIPVIFNSVAIESALGGGEALRTVMKQSGLGISAIFDLEGYMLQMNMGTWLINFLVSAINRIYLIISFSGVQILIFLAGLQSIPNHLYEAAKIEGATQYEIFWKITLPMVSPLILTAAVYTIVSSFLKSPITGVMQTVYGESQYGLYAAMSWMYFIASALLLAIVLGILSRMVFYYDK